MPAKYAKGREMGEAGIFSTAAGTADAEEVVVERDPRTRAALPAKYAKGREMQGGSLLWEPAQEGGPGVWRQGFDFRVFRVFSGLHVWIPDDGLGPVFGCPRCCSLRGQDCPRYMV
jgi:hypothetical protein